MLPFLARSLAAAVLFAHCTLAYASRPHAVAETLNVPMHDSAPSMSSMGGCDLGYYFDGEECIPCTAIDHCTGMVTCTSANDSQCSTCASGYYLQDGVTDVCTACTPVPGCVSPITCTNASDSYCTACAIGYYWNNGQCVPCTAIDHCTGMVTCTSASDSQCSTCASGYYLQDGVTDVCTACAPVPGCMSAITCTNASNSQCVQCQPGYYLSGGVCVPCTAVDHCTGTITCTNSSNSVCTSCAFGYYADNTQGPATVCTSCMPVAHCQLPGPCTSGSTPQCLSCEPGHYLVDGIADQCVPCTPVPGCTGPITCTNAFNSQCAECAPGHYLSDGQCIPCTAIDHCTGMVTCTSASDSQCSTCASAYYLQDGVTDVCTACTPVPGCVSAITCTNASNSQCVQCQPGYYLSAGICVPCTAVNFCTGQVTCTTAFNSQCTSCASGRYLLDGVADTCPACTPVPFCTSSLTCSNAGDSECTSCVPGYYLNGGICTICPPGSYCPDGVLQFPCEAGSFNDLSGQITCVPCAPGRFSSGTGATVCQLCAANTYNPNPGATLCLDCPEGQTSAMGATECTDEVTCTTDLIFETVMPSSGPLPTWEVRDASNNALVLSGGGGLGDGHYPAPFCLPDGDFHMVVSGVPAGATYKIYGADAPFVRVIDNTTPVQVAHQVTAYGNSGGTVQLPMSETRLLLLACDKYWWTAGEYLVANEDPSVAALWNNGNATQQANTGYDFWFYDPNGGYSYVRQRRHNQADGYANVGSARTCHMRVNSTLHGWPTGLHIPNGVPLNVRVRTVVNGVPGAWGPACRFTRDEALAACPPTTLWKTPETDPKYSCDGATRRWRTHNDDRIYAHPVSGASQYRFRFTNLNEGYDLTRTNSTYYLNMGWNASAGAPLLAGSQYQVTVQAFKGGTLGPENNGWCTVGDPCTLTICNAQGNCSGMIGGDQNSAVENTTIEQPVFSLWPNPNRGDQLNLSFSSLGSTTRTITMDILDLSGKRVGSHTIAVQDGTVNTVVALNGDLSAGMYVVHILAGERAFNERLVIQP